MTPDHCVAVRRSGLVKGEGEFAVDADVDDKVEDCSVA